MPEIYWSSLAKFPNLVNQTVREPWLVGVQVITDCTHIRLQVSGSWSILPNDRMNACGPDGYVGLTGPKTILADYPAGALIGRFGGSSAGFSATEAADLDKGKPFPIGAYCIVKRPAASIGPLFIAFNAIERPVHVHQLAITIEGATPTV